MENNDDNKIHYAQITDVGCVRELNEDSLYCDDELWLVADGMGGHACGEVASQLAAQIVSSEFHKHNHLSNAIETAHEQIVRAAKEGEGQYGMGTTVVALTSKSHRYHIAWVGDSRAYLWDGIKKRITQISEDHSLMVRLVKSGLISPEDAQKHPQRHMITQCLGSVEIEKIKVATLDGEWCASHSILLCSDGLSDDVSEQEMSDILKRDLSNEEKLGKLVEKAKQAGGKDNISIVLVNSPVTEIPTLWTKIKTFISEKLTKG